MRYSMTAGKEQGEGNCRDDLRVDDGDLGHRLQGLCRAPAAVKDPDGARRPERGGKRRRGEGKPHRVEQDLHDLRVPEQLSVQFKGEAAFPFSDNVGGGETVHDEQQNGGVDEHEHDRAKGDRQNFLYHKLAPLASRSLSLNPPVASNVRKMMTSRIMEIIEPMCQLS